MKLCHHVQSWEPGVLETVIRSGGPAVKVMDPSYDQMRQVIQAHPDIKIIVRKYVGFDEEQSHFIERGKEGAKELANLIVGDYGKFRDLSPNLYAEGLNEVNPRFMWNDGWKYNDFTQWLSWELTQRGFMHLAYSWAPGNLPGYGWKGAENPAHRNEQYGSFQESLDAHWAHFIPGLQEAHWAGGGLSTHGYGDNPLDNGWWKIWTLLRYRFDSIAIPFPCKIFLTEFGIDRGVVDGSAPAEERGWRSTGISAEEYARQLVVCDNEMLKDALLVCACIFSMGHGWPKYDVVGEPAIIEAVSRRVHTMVLPTSIDVNYWDKCPSGSNLSVIGKAKGIDGVGMITARIGLPPRDPEYGVGTTKLGVPINADGSFSFTIDVPSVTDDVHAQLIINTTELDPSTFAYDAAEASFPLFIYKAANASTPTVPATAPDPVQQPPVQAAVLPLQYDLMFKYAGDIHGLAEQVNEPVIAGYALEMHKIINSRKQPVNPK